jgi:uracil-DNA glycosylase family 4
MGGYHVGRVDPKGKNTAQLIIIGESPSIEDELQGTTFSGDAGRTLSILLESVNIDINNCLLINSVRCRAINNRSPKAKEIKICKFNLNIINTVPNRKLILCLGASALLAIKNSGNLPAILKERGIPFYSTEFNCLVLATHSIKAIESEPMLMKVFLDDIRQAAELLSESINITQQPISVNQLNISLVRDKESLKKFCNELQNYNGILSLDIETDSIYDIDAPRSYACEILVLSFCLEVDGIKKIILVSVDGVGGSSLTIEYALSELKPILESKQFTKVLQGGKYDALVLKYHGINLKGYDYDIAIMHQLVDENSFHGLEPVATHYLRYPSWKTIFEREQRQRASILGHPKDQFSLRITDWNALAQYTARDALATYELYGIIKPLLEKNNTLSLFQHLIMPTQHMFIDIEWNGIRVDLDLINKVIPLMDECSKALINRMTTYVGYKFNPKSSQQVYKVLKDKFNLPLTKKTKGDNISVDNESLLPFINKCAIVKDILQLRTLYSMKNTYIDGLLKYIEPSSERVYSGFKLYGSETGRVISSKPNIQNVPKPELLPFFIPSKGCKFVYADLSQVEARMLALYAKDEEFKKAIYSSDLHAQNASIIFEKPTESISEKERDLAKTFLYAMMYGQSVKSLAVALDVSMEKAKHYMESFLGKYKGVNRFIDEIKNKILKGEVLTEFWGRHRTVLEAKSSLPSLRSKALREGVNFLPQSSAAWLMNYKLLRLRKLLSDGCYKAKIVNVIHDAVLIDTPDSECEHVFKLVDMVFHERIPGMDMDWAADVSIKDRWGDFDILGWLTSIIRG